MTCGQPDCVPSAALPSCYSPWSVTLWSFFGFGQWTSVTAAKVWQSFCETLHILSYPSILTLVLLLQIIRRVLKFRELWTAKHCVPSAALPSCYSPGSVTLWSFLCFGPWTLLQQQRYGKVSVKHYITLYPRFWSLFKLLLLSLSFGGFSHSLLS